MYLHQTVRVWHPFLHRQLVDYRSNGPLSQSVAYSLVVPVFRVPFGVLTLLFGLTLLVGSHEGCQSVLYSLVVSQLRVPFHVFTLLVGSQEGCLACKNLLQLSPKFLIGDSANVGLTPAKNDGETNTDSAFVCKIGDEFTDNSKN